MPVPIYPPMQRSQIEDYAIRQAGILRNAGVRMLITVPEGLKLGALLQGLVATLTSVESATTLSANAAEIPLPDLRQRDATALIQYTSGSTGDPKGVVLSHANLLANIRAIGQVVGATSADVFVSWLPLYHDMGLIGAWLGSLYFGAPFYAMSPLSFPVAAAKLAVGGPPLSRHDLGRTELRLRAVPQQDSKMPISQGLDLGSLRYVGNGAEPVSIDTLRRFTERFAAYGFAPGSDGAGLWARRECRGRHLAARGARAGDRPRRPAGAAVARRCRAGEGRRP